MMLVISQAEIAHEICGVLCSMVESSCDITLESETSYILIKKWEQRVDGTWKSMCITGEQIWQGYRAYAGCGCNPEDTRIPAFISKDWARAEKIYRKLKGL